MNSVVEASLVEQSQLQSHRALMAYLSSLHAPIEGTLTGPVDYVDLPMHGNVGDLLIMAGTLAFFDSHAIRPRCMATYFNYGTRACPPGGTIAFHGGGNFGDIYGPFQAFRGRIIAGRRDCRIVILPQYIHFASADRLDACIALCRQHTDLHICVRDRESETLAKAMTDHVYLLPDMAHQLWGKLLTRP